MHVVALDAFTTALEVPAAHGVTATAPSSQYPPASHAWHDVAPLADWNEPAAHGVHSDEPSDGAKVPAPQSSGVEAPAIE